MKKNRINMVSAAAIMMAACIFSGCSDSASAEGTVTTEGKNTISSSDFNASSDITVISREDSSGTRGAFIELFGIEQKNDAGEKIDHTIETASITQSTGVMKTSVSQNEYAIGYISMGALDDSVKALKIDGATADTDSINNGSYKICRPFNIVTKADVSALAQDFINFILSSDGQAVIESENYIKISDSAPYTKSEQSGKITVAGSSSVTPVMEKLKEAYIALNPNVTIEINQSDSTTGVNSTIEGICDIGMASRELKDSEKESGVSSTVIATDGIAVIVSNDNPAVDLSSDEVKGIYTGEITTWESLMN